LASTQGGEYVVARVVASGGPVDVGKIGESLDHVVRRPAGTPGHTPTYDDIGGLDDVIALLRREIEVPLRRPLDLRQIGVDASDGLLLYGPPGTGKTQLARAVAAHSGAEVIMISGPALAARRRDEAESELREAFQTDPNTARPSLLIVDDIDYLTPTRDSP